MCLQVSGQQDNKKRQATNLLGPLPSSSSQCCFSNPSSFSVLQHTWKDCCSHKQVNCTSDRSYSCSCKVMVGDNWCLQVDQFAFATINGNIDLSSCGQFAMKGVGFWMSRCNHVQGRSLKSDLHWCCLSGTSATRLVCPFLTVQGIPGIDQKSVHLLLCFNCFQPDETHFIFIDSNKWFSTQTDQFQADKPHMLTMLLPSLLVQFVLQWFL